MDHADLIPFEVSVTRIPIKVWTVWFIPKAEA